MRHTTTNREESYFADAAIALANSGWIVHAGRRYKIVAIKALLKAIKTGKKEK